MNWITQRIFEIAVDECIETENKEMTITSIGLSNVDDINIEEVIINLSNDENSMDLQYEQGDKLTIPKNTIASIKILGQMDSLTEKLEDIIQYLWMWILR